MGRVRSQGTEKTCQDVLGEMFTYYMGSKYTSSVIKSSPYYPSYKTTVDEIHPRYPFEGGPFDSRSLSASFMDQDCPLGGTFYFHPVLNRWVTTGTPYTGKYRLQPKWITSPPASQAATCASYGPQAWNKFKPGKPDVGLAQFIAELKDISGLKMQFLQFSQGLRKFLKGGGQNYLAVQFGWRPFINDLKDWWSSIRQIDKRIAALRKLNGQWHRRGGTLFEDSSTSTSSGTDNIITPGNYLTAKGWKVDTESINKCWFKGSFRYFIPGLDDPRWGKLRAISELWDLSITPELVWELLPWSWLVDWFANVGTVISNWQSQISDQVVGRYAYVMYSTNQRVTWRADAINRYTCTYNRVQYNPVHCEALFRVTTKSRAEASPFGFGLTTGGLNAFQLSILAALGLSKSC